MRHAPESKIWLCMMCGKTTKDCYGDERGWDESCALNCILVDEATKRPTEEQAREFGEARQRHMKACAANIASLIKNIGNGDASDIDPELLALAQQVVESRAGRSAEQEQ